MGILDRFKKSKKPAKDDQSKKADSASAKAMADQGKKEFPASAKATAGEGKKGTPGLKLKDSSSPKATKGIEKEPVLKEKVAEVSPKGKGKKKKEDTKNAYKVLIKPVVTEKASDLIVSNKYGFEVATQANKIEVAKAIENLYGVKPVKVNIINMRGKNVRYGRISGKTKKWKKAIVTLKSDDKIEIYEGI